LPTARLLRAYDASLVALDAPGALDWSVVAGELPPGLSLTGSDAHARIAGIPSAAGWYRCTVEARDRSGQKATRRFAIRVAPARSWAVAAHDDAAHGPWTVGARDVSDGIAGPEQILATGLKEDDEIHAPPRHFSFSPDEERLAFTSGSLRTGDVHFVDLRSRAPEALALADVAAESGSKTLLWSPDGVRFVYAQPVVPGGEGGDDDDRHFVVVDATGDEPTARRVDGAHLGTGSYIHWSPDGNLLAFPSDMCRRLALFDGVATRERSLDDSCGVVGWLPGSTTLIYFVRRSEGQRLYVLDVSDPAARPLPLTPPGIDWVFGPTTLSADGGSIALVRRLPNGVGRDSWVVDLRSHQLPVARRANRSFDGTVRFEWSPDSTRLLMTAWDYPEGPFKGVYTIGRDDIGATDPALLLASSCERGAFWASDAQLGCYGSPGLNEVATATGAVSVLDARAVDIARRPVLLDGHRIFIYFLGTSPWLVDAALSDATRTPVPLDGLPNASYYSVSGAGSLVWVRSDHSVAMAKLGSGAPTDPVTLFASTDRPIFVLSDPL
jgi:hypothetical protein